MMNRLAALGTSLGLAALVGTLLLLRAPSVVVADTLASEITDDAFWRMVSDFSEQSGFFRFQLMSNEREFPSVISELKRTTKPGGVYVGVGPEQNFTYIVAVRPKIAFVFDIRRENMIEHLIYKAIFEMSSDRADFVSRLFSLQAPGGLNDRSSIRALFLAYGAVAPDPELFRENLQAIKDHLMQDHRYRLTRDDQEDIDSIYREFFEVGLGQALRGFGFMGVTYADLMTATDEQGQALSYLATEESFQFVRGMERRNLIIPLVGDFAGTKAIRAVAKYLKDHNAVVTAFYTSNVEQYLFQQGDDWRHFYSNVATLPVDSASMFLRSSHFSYGTREPRRQFRRTNYVMLLGSIRDLVAAFDQGRVQNYDQVIRMSW